MSDNCRNAAEAGRVFDIDHASLFPFAMGYAALPLLIFVVSWLRPAFAIILFVVCVTMFVTTAYPHTSPKLAFTCLFTARLAHDETPTNVGTEHRFRLSKRSMLVLAAVALLWCVLGGQGNIWYQSPDWGYRNAIFRDLITHDWPVYYQNGDVALSYYIGYWLPAALVGKALAALGLATDAVWTMANLALLIWSSMGILIVELLVLTTLKPRSAKSALLCIVLLVFFSTPDIIGMLVTGNFVDSLHFMHLEWWSGVGQFSSLMTCLFWAFNQTVIPWICTLNFLQETSFRRLLPIWLCCFFTGPLPSVGLAVMMLSLGLRELVATRGRHDDVRAIVRDVASPQNMLAVPCIIVVLLYFMANVAGKTHNAVMDNNNLLAYPLWVPAEQPLLTGFLCLIAVEGMLIPALLWFNDRRRTLIYVIAITLFFCPMVLIGESTDFCMRASIPAIFSLYLLCAERLFGQARGACRRRVATVALAIVLALGSLTPTMELCRGFLGVCTKGLYATWYDKGTLDDPSTDFTKEDINFGLDGPESSFFFHYLAKPPG